VAEIVGIWRCPARREPMEPLESVRVIEAHGLDGCKHARRDGKRQVLFVAAEDLDAVGVEPGRVRENFTVRGADVMSWPVGHRVSAGEAEFEITMVCEPCEMLEDIRPGLRAEIDGRRGMLARVVRGGVVSVGDALD
jgi:MOSC domain-containing protein YiiM